jgi:outer membrane receptor protein involved in Fe transport
MASAERFARLRGRVAAVACATAYAVLACTAVARAQAVANVGGTIADESGARMPGVTVTVTNKSNGTSQVLVTGPEGNYRAVALQPAPYEIKAELSGFATQARTVTLTVGADATVDFKLTVAALSENVTVSAAAPVIEVSKSELSSVVMSDQVNALPILGRNFIELAQLLPGSAPDNSSVQFFNSTKFGGVADQRNGFTTLIDGGDIDDAIWGSTTVNFTEEAVQEFRVLRNQFDAEYGAALGAVVSVVSKSGTNQYSGTGMYFGRDQALAAKNYFAPTKPAFSQKRAGGNFGGPFAMNRTHFFLAYEYNDVDTAKIIALPGSNPFAAQENGVFPSGSKNHMFDAKVDHRFNDSHSLTLRYAYDNQQLQRTQSVSSDSNQINEFSKTHSVVGEEKWILSQRTINAFRLHYYNQNVGNTVYSEDTGIVRPSVTTGKPAYFPQFFPRDKVTLYDTLYVNLPRHDIKFGGSFATADTSFDSHVFEHGQFTFTTDAPFNRNDPATWPIYFTIANPGYFTYKSKQIAGFVDDTWRVANNVRLNLGLRYDVDTNLRDNDFYEGLLQKPQFAGLDHWVSTNRGNDYSGLQPRLGVTWDTKGDGSFVLRGGLGKYVTRNRPWFQVYAESSFLTSAVTIFDPNLLRNFPDITGVLGGKSLDSYVAAGGSKSPFLIGNDSRLPWALNGTFGYGWQLNANSSLEMDYIHDYGTDQLGSTDLNLPPSGPISDTNPRPVAGYSTVSVLQNYTKSWYDALETQFRTRLKHVDTLLISYTLSRSYRDGVEFYGDFRGTQRTPDERGYNNTDQRHNLTLSAATTLPGAIQVSGIGKFISGSPFWVQAGYDLDGDGSIQYDRPAGLPHTVGRGNVDQQLQTINAFRAANKLPAISASLLKLDPFVSIDARITKMIKLGDRRRIDLFFEGYNLTNHVNYTPFSVDNNLISSSFLVRNGARDGTQAQWGLRYSF